MKSLKERLEEKIRKESLKHASKFVNANIFAKANSSTAFETGAASLVPLVVELADGLKNIKPSLNIAFEDTNDLYYKNVEADLDEALQSLEKFLEGKWTAK